MKKRLFLYGINCSLDVWDEIKNEFSDIDTTFVKYPHKITQNAHTVSDIAKWVYTQYSDSTLGVLYYILAIITTANAVPRTMSRPKL